MHYQIIKFFTLLLFIPNLNAYEINPYLYDGILNNECLKRNNKCYPFVLRINTKIKKVKKILKYEQVKIQSKIIDCIDKINCIKIANILIKNDITNIDLGPFQINYHHNKKVKMKNIFEVSTAKIEVEIILRRLIDRYGYSWKTIGKYHSFKNSRNEEYYLKMYRYFQNNGML